MPDNQFENYSQFLTLKQTLRENVHVIMGPANVSVNTSSDTNESDVYMIQF